LPRGQAAAFVLDPEEDAIGRRDRLPRDMILGASELELLSLVAGRRMKLRPLDCYASSHTKATA
jgi:hypothetical protein